MGAKIIHLAPLIAKRQVKRMFHIPTYAELLEEYDQFNAKYIELLKKNKKLLETVGEHEVK